MTNQHTKFAFIFLAIVILTGSYLRLANLGSMSFWVDEVNHVATAESLLDGKGPVLPSNRLYDRSILFTYLVSASFSLFGVSEAAARLPAALFGILTIPLIYIIATTIWRHAAYGLAAAALYAVHPFMVGWARECRMYTMFQFFFLIGIYGLYLGLESTGKHTARQKKASGFIRKLITQWRLDLRWLGISFVALLVATSLHILSGVVFPPLMLYVLFMFVVTVYRSRRLTLEHSKYFVIFISGLFLAGAAVLLSPYLYDELKAALSFAPAWAKYKSAQDTLYYLRFLSKPFFLSTFLLFLAGTFWFAIQQSKALFFLWLQFVIPVVLMSLFFVLHVERYIFHLYPLYLIIAAGGLVALVKLAAQKIPVSEPVILISGLLLFLLASPWFRFAIKIPNLTHGYNGAVMHLEWRDAAFYTKSAASGQEPILTTLPLMVRHYVGRADYFLLNLAFPREGEVVATNGSLYDYYSNARVIGTLDELQAVLNRHQKAWVVVDDYRFSRQQYIPSDIRDFIKTSMKVAYQTPAKTVSVYAWEEPTR